jgi:hypothetical protein
MSVQVGAFVANLIKKVSHTFMISTRSLRQLSGWRKAITIFSNFAVLPRARSWYLLQTGISSMVQMRYCIPEAASLGSMENRREPRENERLVVYINGRDKSGRAFMQEAVASSLSDSGALLSGITTQVRPGDLLWVEHGGRRSRFKIVWVRDSESQQLIQAAIHRLKSEPCLWGPRL